MNFHGELGYSFNLSDDWELDATAKSTAGGNCLDAFKNAVNQASLRVYLDSLNNVDAFQAVYTQKRDAIKENSQVIEEECDFGKKIAVLKAQNGSDDKFSVYCFFQIATNILGHIALETRESSDADVLFAIIESWRVGGGE